MEEEEEEEEIKQRINNITCNTSFQSLIAIKVQRKDANTGVLAEIVNNFKGCTIQSTIRNSAYSNSD